MKTYSLNRGFTLIELLVVIAIIGILSAVVLASLNSARNKGGDAAVKSNMANIRPQAELYLDGSTGLNYGTAAASSTVFAVAGLSGCTAGNTNVLGDPTIKSQLTSALNASGVDGSHPMSCAVGVSGAYWAVAIPLKTDNTKAWCVSSSGSPALINTVPALNSGNSCL